MLPAPGGGDEEEGEEDDDIGDNDSAAAWTSSGVGRKVGEGENSISKCPANLRFGAKKINSIRKKDFLMHCFRLTSPLLSPPGLFALVCRRPLLSSP